MEWDKHRSTWIQMVDRHKIKQKVSVLLHSISKRYRKTAVVAANNNSNGIVSSDFIVSNSDSGKRSPSMLLSEDLDELVNKLRVDDEPEIDDATGANDNMGSGDGLGPYAFIEGGRSLQQQEQCCQLRNDVDHPSHQQISRKRMKKI